MNDYEHKMLQERESRLIAAGIVWLIFALPVAFILAAFIAGIFTLPFQPVFYTLWAFLEIAGISGVVGGIKEKIERRRAITK